VQNNVSNACLFYCNCINKCNLYLILSVWDYTCFFLFVTNNTRFFLCSANVTVECKALRSKRYISDGFCTSLKPVEDLVCTGNCLPIRDLPWYAEFIKVWSAEKSRQYQCVDDLVRHRKVTFVCESGETRTYDIKVVRSCKCKRNHPRNHNQSSPDDKPTRDSDDDDVRGRMSSWVPGKTTRTVRTRPITPTPPSVNASTEASTGRGGQRGNGKSEKTKGRRRKPVPTSDQEIEN